jgi:hypothetical protein
MLLCLCRREPTFRYDIRELPGKCWNCFSVVLRQQASKVCGVDFLEQTIDLLTKSEPELYLDVDTTAERIRAGCRYFGCFVVMRTTCPVRPQAASIALSCAQISLRAGTRVFPGRQECTRRERLTVPANVILEPPPPQCLCIQPENNNGLSRLTGVYERSTLVREGLKLAVCAVDQPLS